jgi:plasmid replication initiation protein
MKDIVKYHNQMNEVNFNGYSEKELNMFFSLVFLAKEKGQTKLTIPFSELKELADGDKNRDRFIKNLINVNKKLVKLNHQIEVNNVIHIFSLFNTFSIDKDNNELIVQVNEIFSYMLNDLIGNFTKFDLIEFVSLKSSYSKNTFKLLKQWETTRQKIFKVEEFRELLGVPKGYTSTNFNERVLKPILEELPQYFPNLKLEKIKTGKKVTDLKFSWSGKQREILNIKEAEIVELEISEQLNKAIEKAKKNRFIEKLLTLDNIEILTQMFQENDLVKGLLWAYKEVKQDISTLNYLIKTIRTGAEQKEIKIKVKKEPILEVEQKILFDEKEEFSQLDKLDPIEKEKISPDKYEELYKKYLKENEIRHNKITRLGFDKSIGAKYEVVEIPEEKIYTVDELPKEKLLSKNGKELKGVSLLMRLRKLAQDMKISIEYNSEIIKGV